MTWTQNLSDGGYQEAYKICDEAGSNSVMKLRFQDGDNTVIQTVSRPEASALIAGLIEEGAPFFEPILEALIVELDRKNALEPSRESSLIKTKLEEALHWQEARMKRVESEKE